MKFAFSKLIVVILAIALSACETELAKPDLRILNEAALPTEMTWYSPIDVPIEITGGEGGYSVRYIQNPEEGMDPDLLEELEEINLVSLAIVKEEGTQKNTFRLQGTPVPPEGFDVSSLTSSYWIEVSDGVSSFIVRFDFSIDEVVLEKINFSVSFKEGQPDFSKFNSTAGPLSVVCQNISGASRQDIESKDGIRAFPVLIAFRLSKPLAVPFDFSYSLSSSGSTAAEVDVDYLDSSGTISMAPGDDVCGVIFYLLDDRLLEDEESLRLSLVPASRHITNFDEITISINIRDDEPTVRVKAPDYVMGVDAIARIKLALSDSVDHPLLVPFNVDLANTTIPEDGYVLSSSNGLIEFPAGEMVRELQVTFKAVELSEPGVGKLSLNFPNDESGDEVQLQINEFNRRSPMIEGFNSVAMDAVDHRIFLLVNESDSRPESAVRLYGFDNAGDSLKFGGDDYYEFFSIRGGVIGRDLLVYERSITGVKIALLFEVDSNYGGTSWGGRDFVVVQLQVFDDGTIVELARSQHGTQADDRAISLTEGVGKEFFVVGSGEGFSLDANPILSAGGRDGYFYEFTPLANSVKTKSIGDASDNALLGVVSTDESKVAVVSSDDGLLVRVMDETGNDDLDIDDAEVSFKYGFDYAGMLNLGSGRSLITVSEHDGYGDRDRDISLYYLRIDNAASISEVASFSSLSGFDVAVSSDFLEDKEMAGVVGETLGEFDEGEAVGSVGERDVFFASVNVEGTPRMGKITQFGSPGNDYVIDVEAVNDEKFLVLWKEDYSSGDGSFRYRITPFAPDGTNLLPLTW